ncbi:MAG: PIN domain-containing protein [Thermoanaerobaculia bacterium]
MWMLVVMTISAIIRPCGSALNGTSLPALPAGGRSGARLLQEVTSSVTLLETLVLPVRKENWALADRYEEILTDSRGVELVAIDLSLLRAAAHVRAATGMKTPDALQIAAAQSAGCRVFVTNDNRLPPIPGLRVLKLDDYVES